MLFTNENILLGWGLSVNNAFLVYLAARISFKEDNMTSEFPPAPFGVCPTELHLFIQNYCLLNAQPLSDSSSPLVSFFFSPLSNC